MTNSDHDPLCPVDPPRYAGDAYCLWCETLAKARADEREKIARLFDAEVEEMTTKVREYGLLGMGAMFDREREITQRHARIARNGGDR